MSMITKIPKAQFANTLVDSNERIFGMDVIRALSTMVVVLFHSYNIISPFTDKIKHLAPFVWIAQELFYGLSGFLVGRQILKIINKNNIVFKDLFSFYINRWLRTIPLFFFFLIINYILYYYIYSQHHLSYLKCDFNLLDYFLFIQNFAKQHPYFYPEIWSLSVEEWSYLLIPIPIFMFVFIRKKQLHIKHIIILLLIEMFIFNCIRINYTLSHHPEADWGLRKIVAYRLDAILYGFLMGVLIDNYVDYFKRNKGYLFIIGIISSLVTYFLHKKNIDNYAITSMIFTLLPFFTALMLPWFYYLKSSSQKIISIYTHFSIISYPILLSHLYFTQFILLSMYTPNTFIEALIMTFIYLTSAIIFSTFIYNVFEQRLLFFRKKVMFVITKQ